MGGHRRAERPETEQSLSDDGAPVERHPAECRRCWPESAQRWRRVRPGEGGRSEQRRTRPGATPEGPICRSWQQHTAFGRGGDAQRPTPRRRTRGGMSGNSITAPRRPSVPIAGEGARKTTRPAAVPQLDLGGGGRVGAGAVAREILQRPVLPRPPPGRPPPCGERSSGHWFDGCSSHCRVHGQLPAVRGHLLNAGTILLAAPSEAPKACQASECRELFGPTGTSLWIVAQHPKLIPRTAGARPQHATPPS